MEQLKVTSFFSAHRGKGRRSCEREAINFLFFSSHTQGNERERERERFTRAMESNFNNL